MLNTQEKRVKRNKNKRKRNRNRLFGFAILCMCALVTLGVTNPSLFSTEKNVENSNQLLTTQEFYGNMSIQSELPVDVQAILEMVETKVEEVEQATTYNVSNFSTPCIKSRFVLSDDERFVVESIVTGEAGSENYDGKWAVATCIYNACLRDGIQPSQVRTQYQYSGWNTTWRTDHPEKFKEVQEVVTRVFDNGELITDKQILWFYAPKYCKGTWHNTQQYVNTWGTQKFYAPW